MCTQSAGADLSAALDILARAIARHVVAELRSGELADYIDQTESPLGKRKHCAAVRRRVAAADGTAAVIGRRHLLTREALQDELQQASLTPAKRTKAEPKPTVRQELEQELGLKLAGGMR